MIINRIYEHQIPSVAVACFLPGRAKDLPAPLFILYLTKVSKWITYCENTKHVQFQPYVQKCCVEASWNVMAHAQKPDFVFRRNGRVNLNRRGRQFSRLLAAEVCASAVVMLDTPCSEVVWRVLATHCIRQFPLQFPSCASPCAITFQLESHRIETPKSREATERMWT
jgi:hypothetical protein